MTDPAFAADASVVVRDVSVWFGQKVALSELSCSFGPGVTGLLGPNGAGKSTLMRAVTGLLVPSAGAVSVEGRNPRHDAAARRVTALVPEDDAAPLRLTTRQLVRYAADLHGIARAGSIDEALAAVDLTAAAGRRLGELSKGMRQRAKVAAALVTDPRVVVLDEPLNGADPVQRLRLIELFRRLGDEGRTVIVSSHVLAEVERLSDRVLVLVSGRLAAAGDHRAIRDAMDGRPRHVLVRADHPRRLGAALLETDAVVGVRLSGGDLVVSTDRARDLAVALAPLAAGLGVRLLEVRALDDSLESMFRELVR